MTPSEIYKQSLKKWGWEAQSLMAIEEMSELQKVLCKFFRYPRMTKYAEFVEELADVQIMLDQLKLIGIDMSPFFVADYEVQRQKKLTKMSELIKKP